MTSSIGSRPLSSIDKSLVAAGDFLEKLMSNDQYLKCLKAFVDSFKIVEWIRKETPQGEIV